MCVALWYCVFSVHSVVFDMCGMFCVCGTVSFVALCVCVQWVVCLMWRSTCQIKYCFYFVELLHNRSAALTFSTTMIVVNHRNGKCALGRADPKVEP